jgi:sugar lactone lactonase YvrE
MRRALPLVALLALAFPSGASAGSDADVVHISITNSTASALMLQNPQLSSNNCWATKSGGGFNCQSGPQNEIDPGTTADLYVVPNGGVLIDAIGGVTYIADDPNYGFYGSGIEIPFQNVAFTPNKSSCTSLLYFQCTGFNFNSGGSELVITATVTASGTCPGSEQGPCEWSADEMWGGGGTGNGQFNSPQSVSLDGRPLVYVSDTNNSRVQEFTDDGAWLTTFGSSGGGSGQFLQLAGVAGDPRVQAGGDGKVYALDSDQNTVTTFDQSGAFVSEVGLPLNQPTALAVGPNGHLYITDTGNNRVVEVDPQSFTIVNAFGSMGGGPGQFLVPAGIDVDANGEIYVADSSNNRVEQFKPDGTFDGAIGSPGTGLGQFSTPWGVAVLPSGAIAVSDVGNNRIQLFSGPAHPIVAWGDLGTAAGEFNAPLGLAADADGNIYVADTNNNRIQRFSRSTSQVTLSAPPRSAAPRKLALRARNGRVRVALRCTNSGGAKRCIGAVTLHSRRGLFGTGRFSIPNHRRTVVSFGLTRDGRRRLARRHVITGHLIVHTRQRGGRVHMTHERDVAVRRAR